MTKNTNGPRASYILSGLFKESETWMRPEALWHASRVDLANRGEAELVELLFYADFEKKL